MRISDSTLFGALLGLLATLVAALMITAAFFPADAQQPVAGMDDLSAFAHEEITVGTTAVGLTTTNIQPPGAPRSRRVLLTTTGDLRYCVDGTTPTASTCHHVTSGDSWVIASIGDMGRLRMIREDGTDAVVAATYSR